MKPNLVGEIGRSQASFQKRREGQNKRTDISSFETTDEDSLSLRRQSLSAFQDTDYFYQAWTKELSQNILRQAKDHLLSGAQTSFRYFLSQNEKELPGGFDEKTAHIIKSFLESRGLSVKIHKQEDSKRAKVYLDISLGSSDYIQKNLKTKEIKEEKMRFESHQHRLKNIANFLSAQKAYGRDLSPRFLEEDQTAQSSEGPLENQNEIKQLSE